jgi:hypothetical protein
MLRSVEMYLSGVGEVIVVGTKPHWLINAIHLPMVDASRGKARAIFQKMIRGAEVAGDHFIGWNDDTYLKEPMDANELPVYYNSTLNEWCSKSTNILYGSLINETAKKFPGGRFYNVHTPAPYETAKFLQLTDLDWDRNEYLIKSAYFNTYPPVRAIEHIDPKVKDGIPPGPFFSTQTHIPGKMMVKMAELYPKKSKYEK